LWRNAADTIDINCDAGESFGVYPMGDDERIFRYVSSVNIACGFHAGDPITIEKTVRMAANLGLQIGAHPGFYDLRGFGRRELNLPANEIRTDILYQLGALDAFLRVRGLHLAHVKPHGALYTIAARDEAVAIPLVEAVKAYDPSLVLVGLARSAVHRVAEEQGIRFAREAFIDRQLHTDGSLVSRREPGAFVPEKELVPRTIRMIRKREVVSAEGILIPCECDTLCLHSDTPRAGAFAKALREALDAAHIGVGTYKSKDDGAQGNEA